MVLWKLVGLIIGMVVLITVGYAFAGVFIPKLSEISPGANDTFQQFIRGTTPGNEVEPPDSVKESYNNFLTAFDIAKKSGQTGCFVPYAIKPLRSDFKEFSIQIANADDKMLIKISQPAPNKYLATLEGIKADCVVGGELAGKIIDNKDITPKPIQIITVKGIDNTRVELNNGDNFLSADPIMEDGIDIFAPDGNSNLYVASKGEVCFIDVRSFLATCRSLLRSKNPGEFITTTDCINQLKTIKNC